MNRLYGTGVAIITPFNSDGSVDFNGLKNLINFLIEGKCDYLVSLGTTGETATLTKEEKESIWKFTAETVAGRVPLVAGIGGNNTREAVESVKSFTISGYEAILSVSPYYNKPTQEGIFQHYKAIAEASPLPVILYNVPGRTGSSIHAETTLRLAQEKNIIGIKEASGNFDCFNKILAEKPEDFLLISGDDPITLPLIALGAVGVISVVGNVFPKILSKMVQLCLENKFKEAQILHYKLAPVTNLFFEEGNPAGVKAALKYLGVCNDTLRLPLVNVSENLYNRIVEETNKLTDQ
ncbi:4-hydroxy-tetrahydrodipicolinate synthase [Rubrolithibacter danxiaensis]|uniref:4-hydroxy-tetrahydrodipicolinate synthase n=1 Tax=Rubrolithibacter danxiaensis TaxID=3390805 RepID=UPI003BF9215E